jgi:hypothetical protein
MSYPPPGPHPLLGLLLAAADGSFPPVDGAVTVTEPLDGGLECSFAFTGHAIVATRHPADEVKARGADGFGGSHGPDFLRWLAGPDGWIGVIDATLVARGRGSGTADGGSAGGSTAGGGLAGGSWAGGGLADTVLPRRPDLSEHPRAQLALSLRSDVAIHGDDRGIVTVSRGLAGRREVSVEAAPDGQGRGWGRSLLVDALHLVPAGEPVFAAVSPGNARSLRAFLGVGFVPVGSEVILRPGG